MIDVDAASVLLMWATGGLFWGWVTARRRQVGLGYGWTLKLSFGGLAGLALAVGLVSDPIPVRELGSVGLLGATVVSVGVSWRRRKAGVRGQRELVGRRSERVAAMTGIDRGEPRFDPDLPEYAPSLDLVAVGFGVVGMVAGAIAADGPTWLALIRVVTGALFLGVVTDAMLLGHWYLVQPGLPRGPVIELVVWTGIVWVLELIALLLPTGMVSVLDGSIDDGYGGTLGWFWVACVVATIALVFVTRAALREREYSAVMAATGLMYLAILTGFGMALVARVLLDA